MKFDHVVNYNGCYYQAGSEIPVTNEKNLGGNAKTLPSEQDANNYHDSDITLEGMGMLYTRDDLTEMPVREIRRIAEEKGFEINSTIKNDVIQEFLDKQ